MAELSSIKPFFSSELELIRPDEALPFQIHLYLPKNRHIVAWNKVGDTPSAEVLSRTAQKGVRQIWIRREDREIFLKYLRAAEEAEALRGRREKAVPKWETEGSKGEKSDESPDAGELDGAYGPQETRMETIQGMPKDGMREPDRENDEARAASEMAASDAPSGAMAEAFEEKETDEESAPGLEASASGVAGKGTEAALTENATDLEELDDEEMTNLADEVATQMLDEDTPPETRQAIIGRKAARMLRSVAAATTPERQSIASRRLRKAIQHAVTRSCPPESVASALWADCESAQFTHCLNVAAYATTIALACGEIDAKRIEVLAAAAMVHDAAITGVPREILDRPWCELAAIQWQAFEFHDEEARPWVEGSSMARALVCGHHGSDQAGPDRALLQALRIADWIDHFQAGHWSGEATTVLAAVGEIRKLRGEHSALRGIDVTVLNRVVSLVSSGKLDAAVARASQINSELLLAE